jgi:hypothetical protein
MVESVCKRKYKIILLFSLLCLLILLVSCDFKKGSDSGRDVVNYVNTSEIIIDDTSEDIILPEGKCVEKFVCISSSTSALRNSDCEFVNRTTCETECVDGSCKEKEIKICTSGFKCRNDLERAFQREDCSWEKIEKCEFGCDQSSNQGSNQSSNQGSDKCHTASPNNVTKSSTPTKTPVVEKNPTISMGEIVDIKGHNLSIYIIESERVRLKVDDQRSDWLTEGQNITFKNDIKIKVIAVLFQPYEGGKKDVIYTLN